MFIRLVVLLMPSLRLGFSAKWHHCRLRLHEVVARLDTVVLKVSQLKELLEDGKQETDRQDKTRQDKTRQEKTRQDKRREEKRREEKPSQAKPRQDKTRQDQTRQRARARARARGEGSVCDSIGSNWCGCSHQTSMCLKWETECTETG